MAAIVDTAHPLARDSAVAGDKPASSLRLRVLSALVLAPIALASAWFEPSVPSALVVLAADAVMAWEWGRMCRTDDRADGVPIVTSIVVVLAGVVVAALGMPLVALIIAILGGLAGAVASRGRGEAVLVGFGILWIALPSIALIWLALDPRNGRTTILWLLAIVWATDIGAFAAGRTFGGPRLAPRVSPNKTWAGLLGGVVCAAAVGGVTGVLLGATPIVPLVLLSGALAVVAQTGDLAESIAKRHFGVKDSSGLIPGHGGLLDRLDGMLTVVPAVALLTLCGGESVLAWR
jgi:phosphatidate cytidylyltransferase